jgi:IclR family pca regulon transcriptional regulator
MARDTESPDFIEAIARGLDVLTVFGPGRPVLNLTEVATATGLARPTARRILITLAELGYVRSDDTGFSLTPRVLELGMAYVCSSNIWELSRPHLTDLSSRVNESCSVAQLDGADVVYVARVAVPKLVALSVTIGTRFPAYATSLGKVLLAGLPPAALDAALAEPSRSPVAPVWTPGHHRPTAGSGHPVGRGAHPQWRGCGRRGRQPQHTRFRDQCRDPRGRLSASAVAGGRGH